MFYIYAIRAKKTLSTKGDAATQAKRATPFSILSQGRKAFLTGSNQHRVAKYGDSLTLRMAQFYLIKRMCLQYEGVLCFSLHGCATCLNNVLYTSENVSVVHLSRQFVFHSVCMNIKPFCWNSLSVYVLTKFSQSHRFRLSMNVKRNDKIIHFFWH